MDNKFAGDCTELANEGFVESGYYYVMPPTEGRNAMIKVFCEDGWTIVLRRDNAVDANKVG